MDLTKIFTGMDQGPEKIDANFNTIIQSQPKPGDWYNGTWGSGFTGDDVPKLFTYWLNDRMQLVVFSQQFRSVGAQAPYANMAVANFPTDFPMPYSGAISDSINDIATNVNGKLNVVTRSIILTTGGQSLGSGHIFASAAWLSFK